LVDKKVEDDDCPECPEKQKKMEEQKKIDAKPATRLSLRDRILNVNDRRQELVKVPWWDDAEVLMKSLTAGDWAELQQKAQIKFQNGVPISAVKEWSNIEIVIKCAFDPATGSKLFTAADHDMLAQKHPGIIDLLGNVADSLSGLSQTELAQSREDFRKTRG